MLSTEQVWFSSFEPLYGLVSSLGFILILHISTTTQLFLLIREVPRLGSKYCLSSIRSPCAKSARVWPQFFVLGRELWPKMSRRKTARALCPGRIVCRETFESTNVEVLAYSVTHCVRNRKTRQPIPSINVSWLSLTKKFFFFAGGFCPLL